MDEKRAHWLGADLIFDIDFDSGSRGYHVHVQDECIHSFTGPERRKITDYFELNLECEPGVFVRNRKYVGIDPQVTVDPTRLIRLPGSLNIKPGSVKQCAVLAQS